MQLIRTFVALSVIVGAGLVHGHWTNRWGSSHALTTLGARFDAVPMVIGDWRGTEYEVPARERAIVGAEACLSRRYSDPSRGVTVSVLLVGGLPGSISIHTPDVCYRGAGYILNSPTSFDYRPDPEKPPSGFRTALATRGGASPSALRIFWSWNASNGWKAPEEPRWSYASESALCKLYIIRETAGAMVAPESDPCTDFMAELLPEIDRCVFSVP